MHTHSLFTRGFDSRHLHSENKNPDISSGFLFLLVKLWCGNRKTEEKPLEGFSESGSRALSRIRARLRAKNYT